MGIKEQIVEMEPLRGHFHRGSMGATGETTCPIYSLDVTLAPKRVSISTMQASTVTYSQEIKKEWKEAKQNKKKKQKNWVPQSFKETVKT